MSDTYVSAPDLRASCRLHIVASSNSNAGTPVASALNPNAAAAPPSRPDFKKSLRSMVLDWHILRQVEQRHARQLERVENEVVGSR